MYLFFDTETTGLPRSWKAPVTDINNWPRLVQIAALQFDDAGNKMGDFSAIIRPDGFEIPAEASRIHRITTERALGEGRPLREVLDEFGALINASDYLVAHNMSFDEKIAGAEFLRAGLGNPVDGKKKICTMQSATEYCALEGQYGYKWPKLFELHQKLFGVGFDEAHDASVDIGATAKCFWELRRLKVI